MGSSDVDFFIIVIMNLSCLGLPLYQYYDGHDSNCLSDIIGFDIICQT